MSESAVFMVAEATGQSKEVARELLAAAGGSVDAALDIFLNDDGDVAVRVLSQLTLSSFFFWGLPVISSALSPSSPNATRRLIFQHPSLHVHPSIV